MATSIRKTRCVGPPVARLEDFFQDTGAVVPGPNPFCREKAGK